MSSTAVGSHVLKPNVVVTAETFTPLATVRELDPTIGLALTERLDFSAYTRAQRPEIVYGADAEAALSKNDYIRFAVIADGADRLTIERVSRRVATVMLVGTALTAGITVAAFSELSIGLNLAIELVVGGAAACLGRAVLRVSRANVEEIIGAMQGSLAQLPAPDGNKPNAELGDR